MGNFGLEVLGVFGAHDLSVTREEFRVFVRVLMKLSKMSDEKREVDPCCRALRALVFVKGAGWV
jgi:hypothetical protein